MISFEAVKLFSNRLIVMLIMKGLIKMLKSKGLG